MTIFQFKSFSFINRVINRIVEHIKSNAKKQCFFVNLKNTTFWKNTPKGEEILAFFKGMTQPQKNEFFGFFDIFVVGFQNGTNGFLSMTANPSSPIFKKTVFVSISKGYKKFSHNCSERETQSIEDDLRSSINSTPVQPESEFSTSPPYDASTINSFNHQFSPFQNFGGGLVMQPVYQFHQGFGGGPANGFSLFSTQPRYFGGTFQPIVQRTFYDPFTSQANFIPISSMDEPVRREGKLTIRKGRVIREIQIPSGCSSGPSTSSTVGIAKSPRAPTPIAITIANLEKKISKLERLNPPEGTCDYLNLVILNAKLEKIRNSS